MTQIKEILEPFSSPLSSGRSDDGADKPEEDTMTITIKAGDWFKLQTLLGRMDRDYLENLMPQARPSETFLQEIDQIEPLEQ